jgi:hypothetical protein
MEVVPDEDDYSGVHMNATLSWERGHPCPHERHRREDEESLPLNVELKSHTDFALRAHAGRDARAPGVEVAPE